MTKKEIIKWLKESLEDIESGRMTEMDIPDLDLWVEGEKDAFISGMKLVIESLLNNI